MADATRLIEKYAEPESGSPTVLIYNPKHPGVASARIWQGVLKGILIGLLLGAIIGIALKFMKQVDISRAIFFGLIIAGIIIGFITALILWLLEGKYGYFWVDDEKISFWTYGGVRSIDLCRIFGSNTEMNGQKGLSRICYVSDRHPGYDWEVLNLTQYTLASGPVSSGENVDGENGNALARRAVLYHIRQRLLKGAEVTSFPPYRFNGEGEERRFMLQASIFEKYNFRCDGREVVYAREIIREDVNPVLQTGEVRDESDTADLYEYRFRVTDVRVVDVSKGHAGNRDFTALVRLDPSTKLKPVRIDIAYFTNGNELQKYLQCMPGTFPPYDDSGFWDL